MKLNVNYDKPFLNKVKIELKSGKTDNGSGGKQSDKMVVSALGKSLVFSGNLFDCNGDGADFNVVPTVRDCSVGVTLTAKTAGLLKEYSYFNGAWSGYDEIVVAKTNLSDICAFFRCGEVSFFASFDFPYSKITANGDFLSVGCDPYDKVCAGDEYVPHTVTFGATVLTGRRSGEFDIAEIEAMSEYVRAKMPEKFNGSRPIYSSTCITNRMCDVRDGRIFYSMYDNPTLTLDAETLKKEVELCAELGVEYYQVFEGYFDWEEDGSSEKNLKEIVELGKKLGVRVGDYVTALELNCWHYNYHDRHPKDPEMLAMNENGDRYYLCYGSDKTVKMLEDTIVQSVKRNGEEMICIDGNCYVPCADETHGHVKNSVYRLIRGLTRFMEKLNDVSPYFMTWTNAGNWIEFMPKLLWYNPNVYLTDPHARKYESTLNCLKYYGDCRREQMVTVHEKYFVPYTAFTNCEYYAFRHSRVDDESFFEYSFLQGLAVTPNICLGELRTFFERSSVKSYPKRKAFMKKWLKFIRDNIDSWRYVYRVGDAPDAGANECYAHVDGEKGFLCFVNQDCYSKEFTFSLDEKIGLKKGCRNGGEKGGGNSGKNGGESGEEKRFLLEEVYPRVCPIAEQPLPAARFGSEITLTIPAYSVRIIKIGEYEKPENGLRIYGAETRLTETGEYEIVAENGSEISVAVWSENGKKIDASVKTAPNVPKYYFSSEIKKVLSGENFARFTLKMPREKPQAELSLWAADGEEKMRRLTAENSDFVGGFAHNIYRENSKVFLTVTTGEEEFVGADAENVSPENGGKAEKVSSENGGKAENVVAEGAKKRRANVYKTKFGLPFIEYASLSNVYGFDELIEFVFADSAAVKSLKAFINGKEVQVYAYKYPFAPDKKTFYIELTGEIKSGETNDLKIHVEWNEPTSEEKKDFEKASEAGAKVVGQ